MYVWAEGRAHKVFLHGGVLWCRLWKLAGPEAPRTTDEADRMVAAAQRLLSGGVRPLGLVLDTAPDVDPRLLEAPLRRLLGATDRVRMSVALVAGRYGARTVALGRIGQLSAYTRIVETTAQAQAWLSPRQSALAV